LESVGIKKEMGDFKEKYINSCRCCNLNLKKYDLNLKRHEEKNTDVNIAITLLELAIMDQFDKCFVLSSDNDFRPVIKRVKELYPFKRIVLCPPPPVRQISKDNPPLRREYRVDDLEKACQCKAILTTWQLIQKHQFDNDLGEDNFGNKIINPWQIKNAQSQQTH